MPERGTEDIRKEIAAERHALIDDVAALQTQIRSLALLLAAGLAVVALVTWRTGARKGVAMLWKVAK